MIVKTLTLIPQKNVRNAVAFYAGVGIVAFMYTLKK